MNSIDRIWREYHAALHGFIQSRVSDADIADDILQDVFLKIHTGISSLKDTNRLRPWIYQITRNAIIDYYRAHKPHVELPETLVAPEKDDAETARQEIEGCMMPLIKNLSDTYREAVMLSEVEGLTQKHVAERLGLSLSAAKSRIQRGRAMIKDMLNDCCRFEIDHRGTMVDYLPKTSTDKNCCK
ncbi:MAG: RNA polymerase sigma factor SigZ [Mariprofundaceae bacterium]